MSKTKRKICGALLQNRKVTPFIWITVTFTLLSDVMVAVVMAGTGWAWTVEISKDVSGGAYHSYYGLWYVCSRLDNGEGIQDCEPVSDHASFTDWWQGSQTLGVLGAICAIVTTVLLVLYIFLRRCNRKQTYAIMIACAQLATGMTLGGLCALFGVEYIRHARWCCPEMGQSVLNYHLSYCFLLAILAAIFCVASSLVCVLEFLEIRIQEKDKKHFAEMMRGIAVLESRM